MSTPLRWDGKQIVRTVITADDRRKVRTAYKAGIACAEEHEISEVIRQIEAAECLA